MRTLFALILFISLALLPFSACLGEEDLRYVSSWASVDSVAVNSVDSLTVAFAVTGVKPTPCHEIPPPDVEKDSDSLSVTLTFRSRIRSDVLCAQVITAYHDTVSVAVERPGRWRFLFRGEPRGRDIVLSVDVPGRR
jgi:hypothetical protein